MGLDGNLDRNLDRNRMEIWTGVDGSGWESQARI